MNAQSKELLTISATIAAMVAVAVVGAAWGELLPIPSWGWPLGEAAAGGVGGWFSVKAILASPFQCTVAELCMLNDLPVSQAEKSLTNLQEKGLVSGFVAGDLHAKITMTADAAKYVV